MEINSINKQKLCANQAQAIDMRGYVGEYLRQPGDIVKVEIRFDGVYAIEKLSGRIPDTIETKLVFEKFETRNNPLVCPEIKTIARFSGGFDFYLNEAGIPVIMSTPNIPEAIRIRN